MTRSVMYKNVDIGPGAVIEEFVIIGKPPRGKKDGELLTVIGKNAHIRSGTVIYAGNRIGDNFQTGHNVIVRESNTIGDDVSVGSMACIEHHVQIEDGVRMHSQVFVPEYSVLKRRCWLGPKVTLTNAFHPLCPKIKDCLKGPTIEEDAKIGASSTILPAVVIGKKALVGAGSVVVKDVPDMSVVAGNPAKVIKNIAELKCRRKAIERPYGP